MPGALGARARLLRTSVRMNGSRRAVFVPGSGAGAWEWVRWRPVFESAGWEVSALDLEPSRGGIAATTFSDYAAQVLSALAQSGGDSVLVGASLGATLALAAASRAPASALVLVSGVPHAGTPGWPRQPVRFPDVVPWSTRGVAETLAALPDADPRPFDGLPERWRDESGAVMRALWEGVRVSTPSVPVLAVLGESDDQVPTNVGIAMARRLRADVIRLQGASHLGTLLGQRAEFAARLALAWLDNVLGTPELD